MLNLRAGLIMIVSMAFFAVEDMFIKFVTRDIPLGEVMILFALTCSVIFGVAAELRGQSAFDRRLWSKPFIYRNIGETFGTMFYISAVVYSPLSIASAVAQSMPLIITIGAATILGETVGWRRWTAIIIGMIGVMMTINPFGAGFVPASLFAVLGAIGLSVRDLATRALPPSLPTLPLAAWGFFAVIPAGVMLLLATGEPLVMPSASGAWLFVAMLATGLVGYLALIFATRTGDAAAVTPFRYSRIVFAMLIGVIVFDERPDAIALAGAALIAATGLYTLAREARFKRASLAPSPEL